ncbi:MAG: hypothetical protein JNK48_23680 [Bryobacterales bacterium]|nr:hypothetical protein [Bryobacterales bacterium]
MRALDRWQQEIESYSAGCMVQVRVETVENTLRIERAFPGRSVVVRLLRQEEFVRQLVQAHALTVNYSGDEGAFHFILLNQARARDWEGMEEALLAHEYGHVWLAVQGYRSPVFAANCLATAAGDIVQHILIREETARRGFDYKAFWQRTHDAWIAGEAAVEEVPVLDSCGRLLLVAEWVDASLAFADSSWENRGSYFRLLESRHPSLRPLAEDLAKWLRGRNLWDRGEYEAVLRHVAAELAQVL